MISQHPLYLVTIKLEGLFDVVGGAPPVRDY
ncbi:MAG: hypothetical protein ACJA0Z_001346 [Halioglobus sp.]|jgi:hypothetical protein